MTDRRHIAPPNSEYADQLQDHGKAEQERSQLIGIARASAYPRK